MSRKIIGVTVGTTLPKPNFDQTDPRKGDFIKGDRSFLNMDDTLTIAGRPADAKVTGDTLNKLQAEIDTKLASKSDITHGHEMSEVNGLSDALAGKETSGTASTVVSDHNTSMSAHVDMGWLTSIDEVASDPVPFDADTLNGYNATYFDTQIDELREIINNSDENNITGISITEELDGSITMENILSDGGIETIVISADADGNPAGLTYNGKAIPLTFTKETEVSE